MAELSLFNINPENYSGFQPDMEIYPRMLRSSPTHVLASFYGHYFGKEIERGRITVTETVLRNGETIYRVESKRFPVNAVFTTYEGKENIKVNMGGHTYYENTCVFCGSLSTGFTPLEQTYINGVKQPYVCPTCSKKRAAYNFQRILNTLWVNRGVTAFEVAIESMLSNLKVDFQQEYPLTMGRVRGVFDFYVPCANLIIEVEGMAFHTPYSQSKLASSADALIRNSARDMVKISEAIRHGYYVYVIFESDIVNLTNSNSITVTEQSINTDKFSFIQNDLAQLLSLRGCHPYQPSLFHNQQGRVIAKV
ncbi:MAG: hypothetical protein QXL94_00425 [Candidatus Parvarchaeum sp.]